MLFNIFQVLICLGICIYERLQRISLRLREEEGTCQALAAIGVEALYRKFETAVEMKSGVSKLQLLYDEITQEELSRQQRKEQKKLKKRKKKERQSIESKCKVYETFEHLFLLYITLAWRSVTASDCKLNGYRFHTRLFK